MCGRKRFIGMLIIAVGVGVFIALVFPTGFLLWVLGILIVAAGVLLVC